MLSSTVYINKRGFKVCPKEETYVETLSPHDKLQNKILRSLFDTNPKKQKPVKEIISYYTTQGYQDTQIKDMITYLKYAELVNSGRSFR
jgi:hypothetical protein